MARGQRRPAEDLIKEIDEKIARHKESIKSLEERRADLLKQQKKEEINALLSYMQTNNISVENIMDILQNQ